MIGLLEWNVDAFPFNFRCIAAPDAQFVDSQRDPRSSEEL
jgi:hypothetical protein